MGRVAFLSSVLLGVMGSQAMGELPLTLPDLDRPFVGLIVSEDSPTHVKNVPLKRSPQRKGVFVDSASPGSPAASVWSRIESGAMVSKINRTPVRSADDFLEAVAELQVGKECDFEISQATLNKSKQPAWSTPKRVTLSPVAYRDWIREQEVTEQDSLLDQWTAIKAGRSMDNPADPHLRFQVKDDAAENLQLNITCYHDAPVFIKSLRVKVGEAVYELPVKSDTPRIGDRGGFVEACSLPVTGKAIEMVRDVAFGSGECAIQFVGPKETSSWTVSEPGRDAFRETLIAFGLRGHLEVISAK